jgi:hypothetical protein
MVIRRHVGLSGVVCLLSPTSLGLSAINGCNFNDTLQGQAGCAVPRFLALELLCFCLSIFLSLFLLALLFLSSTLSIHLNILAFSP